MTSPLQGSLARTIGSAFSGLFLDAVLERDVPIASSPARNAWDEDEVQTVSFPCKAIHDEFETTLVVGSQVQASDRKILVLASSLATEPKPGDKISIGTDGPFTIVPTQAGRIAPVKTDPAKAVWELRCNK